MLRVSRFGFARRSMALALALTLGVSAAQAQTKPGAPEFPQEPAQWIHGRPITIDNLKGKAAFLWYFSEQCPKCKAKWPGMMEMAKKYQDKPIVFIAVNSGAPRSTLEAYVRETGLTWPILVDTSRDFESRSGINPVISLQNVYQLKMLTPDGRLQSGNFEDMEGSIEAALKGAAWKVDPKEIPPGLQPAWQAIEFGNYAYAGPIVKKALTAPHADLKEGAEKLKAAVQVEIDAAVKVAQEAEDKGNSWAAYSDYGQLAQRFAGFELPPAVEVSRKRLATDPKVKLGLTAQHDLDAAKRLLSSTSTVAHKKGTNMLDKIVKDAPDTDAAKEAQAILTELNLK
ncbi:MAG TPA: redoxin domain-containing protein [Pirellulales bacterium]|jgi:thiol-disulfide isomerase/thioredoxin|nr:redoxin domain-containing protein [Pirellulales bacterium]